MAKNRLSSAFEKNRTYLAEEMHISEENRQLSRSRCEICLRENSSLESETVFLCFECEVYICVNCKAEHISHGGLRVETMERNRDNDREESDIDRTGEQTESGEALRQFIDELMNETKTKRKQKLKNRHISIHDRVKVTHELDKKNCGITGFCGTENKMWVVCDNFNSCIKIFKVGSNVLQRYIWFQWLPWGVTEIHVEQTSIEPNLLSDVRSDVSVTDRAEPYVQCLIGVTLPTKHQIMLIDLNRKPALTHDVIFTEKECYSIQFYNEKILTVCREPLEPCYSVYIKSTSGATLTWFKTDITRDIIIPRLAVNSGRLYLTDYHNNKVQCNNVQGQIVSEITVEGSGPVGITIDSENDSVDPDTNNLDIDNDVYVCAWSLNNVLKLDSGLTRCNAELDQHVGFIERPYALCYYRNKLFMSHRWPNSLGNFVTVVRLL